MISRTGMRMRRSREGVRGNNAVQFQSYNGSSYCTALGKNGCTDIVFGKLRDSSMVRRWCGKFTEDRTNVHNEDRSGRPIPGDARTDGKRAASSFAEPALHNFGTIWSIPSDVLLAAARNRLPVAEKRFHDVEVQYTVQ